MEAGHSFNQEIEAFFKPRSYGAGLNGVGEMILDLDVMLDWDEMIHAGSRRKAAVLRAVRKTVRDVFGRRRWKDFDVTQFLLDLDTICERLARV